VLACLFCALTASMLVLMMTRSVVFAAIAGAAAATLPLGVIRRVAARRMMRFEEQFPEAIDLLARAMRAGHALTTGLQMVGEEIGEPVGSEFRTLFEQQNYGMPLPEALRAFAGRVPSVDSRFFVTALLTQRESGGNLTEVLDNLASVIRERFKVKRQVRVMSAHGRITGWALGLLPPTVAGLLLLISPTHIRLLVDDPLGVQMVTVAIGLQVVGVLIIRRIVNVEY
jgi:tight adherence protein B